MACCRDSGVGCIIARVAGGQRDYSGLSFRSLLNKVSPIRCHGHAVYTVSLHVISA